MFESVFHDIRYAVRSLRRTPGFTLVAIVTLAVGIGANAAIFSVFDAVILRPLPYQSPDRLYVIHETGSSEDRPIPANAFHFQQWRHATRTFEEMALVGSTTMTLRGSGEPTMIDGARVTPSLFRMLGAQTALGRLLRDEEDAEGRDRVVVLSHELWATRFGSDRSLVGRTISLDGEPHEVVGVLPAGFELPKLSHFYALEVDFEQPQFWKPFAATQRDLRPLNSFNYIALGRVRPGVTEPQALQDLLAMQKAMVSLFPQPAEYGAVIVPLSDQVVSRSRTALQLVLAAVAMVLLIACVNITNLLLARGARRQREFAVRRAAGAHRRRLLAQMMVESLVLSTAAGAIGVAVGTALIRLIQATAPVDVPRIDEATIDLRVLLFTFGITLASGLLIGLVPAWRATRASAADVLRSSSALAVTGRGAARVRSLLVGVEVAASAICVVAGALLVNSFVNLMAAERGFEAEGVVTTEFVVAPPDYEIEAGIRFLETLTARVRALPGVTAVGITDRLPLSGVSNSGVTVEGTTQRERTSANIRLASRGYFDAMGIGLVSGRLLEDTDTGVAVIGAKTAERLWPGQNALGKRFRHGPDDAPWVEVVGVVEDVRAVSLIEAPPLTIYRPMPDFFYGLAALTVRSDADPRAIAPAIQRAVRELDPQIAVPRPQTMTEIIEGSVAQRRFQMNLMLLLAGTAAFLAALGIYGVVTQVVTQRTSEFGVRMALGADSRRILTLVVRRALVPVGAGLAAGIILAAALGRFLQALLFGITPTDVMPFAVAAVFLGVIALLATLAPAHRATRVHPLEALRAE